MPSNSSSIPSRLALAVLLLGVVCTAPALASTDGSSEQVQVTVVSSLHGTVVVEGIDVPASSSVAPSVSVLIHEDPALSVATDERPECKQHRSVEEKGGPFDQDPGGGGGGGGYTGTTSLSGNCVGAPFNC